MRRTRRRDNTQVKAKAKVEENLGFFALIAFIASKRLLRHRVVEPEQGEKLVLVDKDAFEVKKSSNSFKEGVRPTSLTAIAKSTSILPRESYEKVFRRFSRSSIRS